MSEAKVGSIVFGPKLDQTDRQHWRNLLGGYSAGSKVSNERPCNCIGPQPGETKCPCALVGEAAMGRKMVEEGVTINGVHYRLVPVEAKSEVGGDMTARAKNCTYGNPDCPKCNPV